MQDLIKVTYQNDNPTVSARDLHEFLEVKEKYTDWVKRMFEYGFNENIDYLLVSEKRATNNPKNPTTSYVDHQLTVEMGKEIAMLQRSEKGKEARTYFIQLEKAWNTPEMVMSRALKMAQSQMDKLVADNSLLQHQSLLDKPKVVFADAVATSKTSILIGELAKLIKQNGVPLGQKRMFIYLRDNGYLIKRKGTEYNTPTQKSMELGLFEIKETSICHADGHTTINKTSKCTGKGQLYFINKFLN